MDKARELKAYPYRKVLGNIKILDMFGCSNNVRRLNLPANRQCDDQKWHWNSSLFYMEAYSGIFGIASRKAWSSGIMGATLWIYPEPSYKKAWDIATQWLPWCWKGKVIVNESTKNDTKIPACFTWSMIQPFSRYFCMLIIAFFQWNLVYGKVWWWEY